MLEPFQLGHLQLRNRILSTSHAPAFAEQGHPRDRYRLYHEEKAKGGLALTMIGGSTNIAPDSPSVFGQLYAGDDSIIPWFQRLTDGVKSHGAAVMCQLTHMGRRTLGDDGHWLPVIGASARRERAHRSLPKPMEDFDFRRVIKHFADAAERCQRGGFDGIELLSHSHLLGQFLSPVINTRTDAYGGSLDNRLRLTLEVLAGIRDRVGDRFIVGIRLTGDELLADGLTLQDGIEVTRLLEKSGLLDFFNIMLGAPYDDLGLAHWVAPMGNQAPHDLDKVGQITASVSLPVFHAGGIADISTARQAVSQGKVDMIGMTRAHIADPHLVRKLIEDREDDIRPCVGLGYCVDRVNQGKDAVCGHNAATGREQQLLHVFPADLTDQTRVVVIGGGPAGMEAARVLAARGAEVVLFEATSELGGQLHLASRGELRRQIWGVAYWLQTQLEKQSLDIRYNTYAEADEVLAERPQLVVVATGGMPEPLDIPGAELALSSWDVLTGDTPRGDILLFDELGDQQAGVVADVLCGDESRVTHVTPDRSSFMELGPTNSSVVLRHLYRKGVEFEVSQDLVSIAEDGDKKRVTLRHTLTGKEAVWLVDSVVVEHGVTALSDVYEDLKPASRNGGEFDQEALIAGQLSIPVNNPVGSYDLVRIGDAVSGRNLHAAIHDALRLGSLWRKA